MALKAATGQALQLPNSQRIWHHPGQPRHPASADGEAKHRLPLEVSWALQAPNARTLSCPSHIPFLPIPPLSRQRHLSLLPTCPPPPSCLGVPQASGLHPGQSISSLLSRGCPRPALPICSRRCVMALLQPPPLWAFSDPLTKPNVSRDLEPLSTLISEL